jgi:hypothetical protein
MSGPLVSLQGLRVSLPNRAAKPMFGPAPMIEMVSISISRAGRRWRSSANPAPARPLSAARWSA